MAGRYLGEPPRAPTMDVLRIFFVVVGLASFGCGYFGLDQYLHVKNPSATQLDVLYYALQLFVLGSPPLDDGGKIPPLLEFARFGAPAVTAYAFVEAGRLVFATELRRLRTRWARNHVIVCGDGMVAGTLARRLRATGRRVVTVSSGLMESQPDARHVTGAARDPYVLRAAGIGRATALYACTEDSAANTAIALAAARHGRRGRHSPIKVYAEVSDPELCLALQARHLGRSEHPGARIEFFNIDNLAARKLFTQELLLPVDGAPPRVVVIGATAFGYAVLIELARRWRIRHPLDRSVMRIALVDEAATAAAAQITARYPFLRQVCRIAPHDGDLRDMLTGRFPLPPDRVFICYDDEQRALKTALVAEQVWPGSPGSIVVRLDRLAGLREAFGSGHGEDMLDSLTGALRLYGVVHAACDPELIGNDLARIIHESYVVARRRHGEDPMSNTALVEWEDLPETLRQSNRAQAEDIARKLNEVGCVISPRLGPGDEYVLAQPEIDRLAMLEHQRWVRERTDDGWRYGTQRDDARRLHPALLTWDDLSEDMRERNQDAIRELPAILADAGFRIVRVRQV